MCFLWHLSGARYVDETGRGAWPRCVIRFYDAETGDLVPVYQGADLREAFPEWAVRADDSGLLPAVYLEAPPSRLCEQRAETEAGKPILELSAIGVPVVGPKLNVLQGSPR